MAILVKCACGKRYNVQPKLAGRKVRCPECGAEILVPSSGQGGAAPPQSSSGPHGVVGTAGGASPKAPLVPRVVSPGSKVVAFGGLKRDALDELMLAEAGGLPLSPPGSAAGAADPLAPLGMGHGLGRAPGPQGSGSSAKTTWIVVGCCSAGGVVLLLIALVLAASLGSRRPSPPPMAGTPPQAVPAPNVPAQPAPVPPWPPARPVWEPNPQLAATLGQEITFHGVALRLPQGVEELKDLPPMHPHPNAEQKAYRAILSGDMQASLIVVQYIPRMMAGLGKISVSAVEQEFRTAFVFGLKASDVQSEIGMVGGAEVVRFRLRALFDGVEYWQQVLCLPQEDGVVLLTGLTAAPPDSASYNLVGCSLLTLRRI